MKRVIIVMAVIMVIGNFHNFLALGNETVKAPMNQYVMRVVKRFPTDGTHQYWWPKGNSYDGATTDVYYLGFKVLRGDAEGRSYCCGLTLQVFYQTLQDYFKDKGVIPSSKLPLDKVNNFKYLWFCPQVKSPGPVEALEKYALGERVKNLNDAQPGDFVQFWRNNGTGHSVIFINWLREAEGNINGLIYWSTQKATNGIGYQIEDVGEGKKEINKDLIFIGRLAPPQNWQ